MTAIYGLFDANGRLRYIRKANNPAERLKGHMRETRRQTPLYDWLRKHGLPEMRVLEANCRDWREAERRIIREARERGDKLLNVADGGDEPHCSTEVRARNGKAVASDIHSDPRRKKLWRLKRDLGQALKKGWVSEVTRAKMREAAALNPAVFGDWAGV